MFAHRAANPLSARPVRNNERGVCDMRAASRLIAVQRVTADDSLFAFGKSPGELQLA